MADSVYWMARYIERAENVARFIGVNLNLQLDLPLEPAHQWQPLIDTSGDAEVFQKRYGEATQANVIEFLAFDAENPNSIYFVPAGGARECALRARDDFVGDVGAGQQHVPADAVAAGDAGTRGAARDFASTSAWAAICSRASPTPP